MPDTFRTILADADNAILDALGETVTIIGKGELVGVLDQETQFDLDVQGTNPVFSYQQSDLTVVVGDGLTYGGNDYTVRKVETDGIGMGRLILSEN